MHKPSAILFLAGFTAVLSAGAMGSRQPDPYFDSFEDGVPRYFTATRAESLSLSPWHYKHGTNSLRWDWTRGEELVIRRGIGNPARVGGYKNAASFIVCLYLEKPVSDTLVFEFRKGDQVTGSFRFPLQFSGWRHARVIYDYFPEGKPAADVDHIRIATTGAAASGTVFFDLIKYNALTWSKSGAILPEKTIPRRRPIPDERLFPRPDRVTEAERAGLRKLGGTPPPEKPGTTEAQVTNLCAKVGALGIVRDEHGVRGPGLGGTGFYIGSPGEHGAKDVQSWPDEHGPNGPDANLQSPGAACALAGTIAGAYRAGTNDAQRSRLADAFLLVADYLIDQNQSLDIETVIRMRELLAQNDRLNAHVDALLVAAGCDEFFVEGDAPVRSNMDFYAYYVRRHLRFCFTQPDEAERVRWMNAWKAMLERSMLQPSSGFKIDGSAYHHRGHYHSYAQNAFSSLPRIFMELRDTPWRPSAEAHAQFRRAMLAQRFYCNRLSRLIALNGRSPFAPNFDGILWYGVQGMNDLALLGTPDGSQKVDLEVAAAYLRLAPQAVTNEPYLRLGLQPEPDPAGTFAMPYAALLCHRRDNWLAGVKGQSKYCWGSERQAQRNCYGLFQGLGSLEVLAGGNPVNARDSGRDGKGWDWRRYEGTTAPQLPLKDVDNGWFTKGEVTFSPETFANGLSHQGRQGVFAMIVNLTLMPEKKILSGRKSWFFNDDQIVCLGSDISCDEAKYPTQTTLCQKTLVPDGAGKFLPTLIDGTDNSTFPMERELDPAKPHWFQDVQQTGYYLPAGQQVTVTRRHQKSRDVDDWNDTEGDFLTAWLDHGKAPRDAGYEYMLATRATSEAMKKFAADPPYRVLQQNRAAHIVRHTASGRWGAAFFEAQEVAPTAADAGPLPVTAVDRPCLVMAEPEREGRLELSAADPDLNLAENEASQPRPLRLTLRGTWRLAKATGTIGAWPLPGADGNVRIASTSADRTVLEIVCQHGASYDIRLAR